MRKKDIHIAKLLCSLQIILFDKFLPRNFNVHNLKQKLQLTNLILKNLQLKSLLLFIHLINKCKKLTFIKA